jgi:hypothetical protein
MEYCIGILIGFILLVCLFLYAKREYSYFERQAKKEVKKEPEFSSLKLELQNTTSLIRDNDNMVIEDLYESEYKPLVLQHLRKAAVDGQIDQYIIITSLVAEHIFTNNLKLNELDMIDKIYKMFKKDLDFKGFHISTYRSSDYKYGLFFSWS